MVYIQLEMHGNDILSQQFKLKVLKIRTESFSMFIQCIGQAWYLMVDMQLALLSPIVIFAFLKWPKIGLAVTFILTTGSTAAAFAYTYIHKFPWTIFFLEP